MYHLISFNSLYQKRIEIEEIEFLNFQPLMHTYKRVFLEKEEACKYFLEMKFILFNTSYLNKLGYSMCKGKQVKQEEHHKKMDKFYLDLLNYTDYNQLLKTFKNLWIEFPPFELLPIEVLEKLDSEIDSNRKNGLYMYLSKNSEKAEELLEEEIKKDMKSKNYSTPITDIN